MALHFNPPVYVPRCDLVDSEFLIDVVCLHLVELGLRRALVKHINVITLSQSWHDPTARRPMDMVVSVTVNGEVLLMCGPDRQFQRVFDISDPTWFDEFDKVVLAFVDLKLRKVTNVV